MRTYLQIIYPPIQTSALFEIPPFEIPSDSHFLDEVANEKKVDAILQSSNRDLDGGVTMTTFMEKFHEMQNLLKSYKPKNIQMRIICPFSINSEIELKEDFKLTKTVKNILNDQCSNPIILDDDVPTGSIVLHIHGGGFVAMSSFTHECYLR